MAEELFYPSLFMKVLGGMSKNIIVFGYCEGNGKATYVYNHDL